MKKIFLSLLIAVLLSSCASHYKGRNPDLSLKGVQANTEVRHFEIKSDWLLNTYLGEERYSTESLEPVMEGVSPEAHLYLRKSMWWKRAMRNQLVAGLAVATLSYLLSESKSLQTSSFVFIAFLGTSIGAGVYSHILMERATERYNVDLKSKFIPQLTFNHQF